MKVKDDFMQWMSFKIQNGEQAKVLGEQMVGEHQLKTPIPKLIQLGLPQA